MQERQQTFGEINALGYLRTLNQTQQRIYRLLTSGDYTQSEVARRLHISRQYVSRLVGRLRSLGLLVKKHLTGHYNTWYETPAQLKSLADREVPDTAYSNCRVHNISLKYPVQNQSADIRTDKRTGYLKSWTMRGGRRHKFIIPGEAGKPDIVIDSHPGTIVAYPVAGQTILCEHIEDAETAILTAIHEAVLVWLQRQRSLGVRVSLANPAAKGIQVSRTHYGFAVSAPDDAQVTLPGFFIDNSPQSHGQPYREVETLNPAAATALDRGLNAITNLDRTVHDALTSTLKAVMPAAFEQATRPLTGKLASIESMICAGTTQQYREQQYQGIILAFMQQVNDLTAEVRRLSAKVAE